MNRVIPVLVLLLLAACSTSRRMQRETDRRVAETGTLQLARTDSTESRSGGTRLLQERRTERTTERAALWQLREEYSAPDSAGRQWPTARTLTRAGRSTETDRRTVSADSASRRTAETGRLHEYAYDNHWSEKTDRGEESKQRDASRIPVILSVLAVLAAVYFGVKHYLKKKR